MWPDLVAWTAGALLLALLPLARERAGLAVASGWLLAALGNAVLGLLQYFDLENGFFPWVVPTVPGYVTGNVHQVNMLATLLAVGVLCVWWLLVKRLIAAGHATWIVCLLLVALAATASRTGMLHMIVISFLLLYWHSREWRRVLLVVFAAWAVYLLVGSGLPWLAWVTRGIAFDRELIDRFRNDSGCQSRFVLWGNMLELIRQKPWTGWGSGELLYAQYITDYKGIRFCDKLSNAHNLPLHLAVTMGLPVAVVSCSLFVYGLFKVKPWAAAHATERLCWAALTLIGVHSLLEYPLWFGVFQLMAALAAWQIFQIRRAERELAAPGVSVHTRLTVSAVLLAGLAFVAWDYVKVSQLYLPEDMRMARYKEDTFDKARGTVFFNEHVLIAQVVAMPLNRDTAELILHGALESLHVAPDSRIIRRVIEAAALLGRDDLVQLHVARYKAAWPKEYAEWVELQRAAQAR